MRKPAGFTLVELLIAVAIAGIVLVSVYSSFALGLRSWKSVDDRADYTAQNILIQLTRELRCAYQTGKEDARFVFQGNAASLRFTTVAPIDEDMPRSGMSDLRRVRYSLGEGDDPAVRSLLYEISDAAGSGDVPANKPRCLSRRITVLTFAFYDGKTWRQEWNSAVRLPEAVQVSLRLRGASAHSSEICFLGMGVVQCSRGEPESPGNSVGGAD